MENKKLVELIKRMSGERNQIPFSEIFDFIGPKIKAEFIFK